MNSFTKEYVNNLSEDEKNSLLLDLLSPQNKLHVGLFKPTSHYNARYDKIIRKLQKAMDGINKDKVSVNQLEKYSNANKILFNTVDLSNKGYKIASLFCGLDADYKKEILLTALFTIIND